MINKQSPYCHYCRKEFFNFGYVNYCSQECKKENLKIFKKIYNEKNPRKYKATEKKIRFCNCSSIIEKPYARNCFDCYSKIIKTRMCKGCNKPLNIKGKQYCSNECRPKKLVNKEYRKCYVRKARKDGRIARGRDRERAKHYVVEYTYTPPLKILDRDNWRCHLCLTYLDRALRGKNLPSSPEIDHIIPISLGGPHIESNLACICRACNIKKSNKIQ